MNKTQALTPPGASPGSPPGQQPGAPRRRSRRKRNRDPSQDLPPAACTRSGQGRSDIQVDADVFREPKLISFLQHLQSQLVSGQYATALAALNTALEFSHRAASEAAEVVLIDDLGLSDDMKRGLGPLDTLQSSVILPIIQGQNTLVQSPAGRCDPLSLSIALLQGLIADQDHCQILIVIPGWIRFKSRSPTLGWSQHLQATLNKIWRLFGHQNVVGGRIVVGTAAGVMEKVRSDELQVGRVRVLVLDDADWLRVPNMRELAEALPPSIQTCLFCGQSPALRRVPALITAQIPMFRVSVPLSDRVRGRRHFYIVLDEKLDAICRLASAGDVVYCDSPAELELLGQRLSNVVLLTDDQVGSGEAPVELIVNYSVPSCGADYVRRLLDWPLAVDQQSSVITVTSSDDRDALAPIGQHLGLKIEEIGLDGERRLPGINS